MARTAHVYVHDRLAGILREDETGFTFVYTEDYVADTNSLPVSLTLPKSGQPLKSEMLFPFFDGLIPEGWLLDIATDSWKLDARDRMGLLMACCQDCIGAVSIIPVGSSYAKE
jgi:serine/threonine-protein kinase HipA